MFLEEQTRHIPEPENLKHLLISTVSWAFMLLSIAVVWLTADVEVMSSQTADNRQPCSSQSSVPLNDTRTKACSISLFITHVCLHDHRSLPMTTNAISGGSLNWRFTMIQLYASRAEVLKSVKHMKWWDKDKVKGKAVPVLTQLSTTPWRKVGEWSYWGEWSASRPCWFIPGTHCIGGWVDPRSAVDVVEQR
jgi:hypothetical protein